MIYMDKRRHEIEEAVEADLLVVAGTMIRPEPDPEDLKIARDYLPTYFGGLFPTLGLLVDRTEGQSRLVDKRERPGLVRGRIVIYHPSMPVRGARTQQDDQTGPAKRLTRRIRGEFLELVFASRPIGPYFRVVESRGGDVDEMNQSRTDEKEQRILWLDVTQFEITL